MIVPKKTLYFLYLFEQRQLYIRVLPNYFYLLLQTIDLNKKALFTHNLSTAYPLYFYLWITFIPRYNQLLNFI
jgi:hypothetical protein